jgi:group I intron endonuclease
MIVYRVTNKINRKVYIGKTKHSLLKRQKSHLKSGHRNYFQLALKKYGAENFYWEILEDKITDEDLLNQKERYYIRLFKSNDRNFGYNLTEGGEGARRRGWHHHPETKSKIGKANKGLHRTTEQRAFISETTKKAGWKPSPEQLERMRLRELGKKHSEETKRKQSVNQIGLRLGWKHSEKTKKEISSILKESKPIKFNGFSYKVLFVLKDSDLSTAELKSVLGMNFCGARHVILNIK